MTKIYSWGEKEDEELFEVVKYKRRSNKKERSEPDDCLDVEEDKQEVLLDISEDPVNDLEDQED